MEWIIVVKTCILTKKIYFSWVTPRLRNAWAVTNCAITQILLKSTQLFTHMESFLCWWGNEDDVQKEKGQQSFEKWSSWLELRRSEVQFQGRSHMKLTRCMTVSSLSQKKKSKVAARIKKNFTTTKYKCMFLKVDAIIYRCHINASKTDYGYNGSSAYREIKTSNQSKNTDFATKLLSLNCAQKMCWWSEQAEQSWTSSRQLQKIQ